MDLTKFYYSASVATGNADNDGVVFAKDANGIETEIARFVGLNVDAISAPQDGKILAAISYGSSFTTSLVVEIDETTGAWDVIAQDLGYFVSAAEFKEDGTLVAVTSTAGISPDTPNLINSIVEIDQTTGATLNTLQTTSQRLADITTIGNDVWVLSRATSVNDIPEIYNVAEPTVRTPVAADSSVADPKGAFTTDDGKIILTFGGLDNGVALEFDPTTKAIQAITDYNPALGTATDATSRATGTVIAPPPPPPPAPTDPVFGTDGPDVLTGDAGDNVIIALGGDDAIIGLAGNDALLGGDGNDSIDAGDGNDQLFGEFGDDTLFGGAGDDALFGGLGNDYLVGDADGTTGIDGIFGGEGNDTAFGGFGADYIDGGAGGDSLYGETGADEILGGEGNDFIDGGTENDIINGGVGNDILLGGLGDDQIRGGDGDDSILGQEGNDFIFGDLGNDTIDGGSGDDQILGGDGDDTIFDAEGNNTLIGGNGNNSIFAGTGDDKLFGGDNNDVLFGGDGNDYLAAGAGIDVVNGGAGADDVRLTLDSGQIFWQDFENGIDKISLNGFVSAADYARDVTVSATADGNSTLISYGQTQLFLENVDAGLIDEQDFLLSSVANLDDLA